jgi:hypothetical protein
MTPPMKLTYTQLTDALREAGLRRDDVVMVQSPLPARC